MGNSQPKSQRRMSYEAEEPPEFNANVTRALWANYFRSNSSGLSKSFKKISMQSHLLPTLPSERLQHFIREVYPTADDQFIQFLVSTFDEDRVVVTFNEFAFAVCLFDTASETLKLKYLFQLADERVTNVASVAQLKLLLASFIVFALSLGRHADGLAVSEEEIGKELAQVAVNGRVTLEQWLAVTINKQPLLLTIALNMERFNASRFLEGKHLFSRKHFNSPTYCAYCNGMLYGLGKQGLSCDLCRYTVHESCVLKLESSDASSCRGTSVNVRNPDMKPAHVWVGENISHTCVVCSKAIRSKNHFNGLTCAWCKSSIHADCKDQMTVVCSLGEFANCIIPPTHIVVQGSSGMSSADKQSVSNESVQMFPVSDDGVPLCVFINSRSGANQGTRVMRKFRYILNPRQVFDLAEGGPANGLQQFASLKHFRVICCGGDGTVGWVLSALDRLKGSMQSPVPVGIVPLGTGNDLARVLGWGGGYTGEDISLLIRHVMHSQVVPLDRWNLAITAVNPEAESDPVPLTIMNNYFSVGVDASIALRFHNERLNHPNKFKSRAKNKLFYAQYGAAEAISSTCADLNLHVELYCDGTRIALPSVEGIAVLNIPSMYGGSDLWGTHEEAKFKAQSIGDELIEVVGIYGSFHVAKIKGHVTQSAKRIAQGHTIEIRTRKLFPMQVDGEPWMQSPCSVIIDHASQSPMLKKMSKRESLVQAALLTPAPRARGQSMPAVKLPLLTASTPPPIKKAGSAMEGTQFKFDV